MYITGAGISGSSKCVFNVIGTNTLTSIFIRAHHGLLHFSLDRQIINDFHAYIGEKSIVSVKLRAYNINLARNCFFFSCIENVP